MGAAFGFYKYNQPHKNIGNAISDFELSSVQLFSDFELNEKESNTKYLDKIIEVNGVVNDFSKDDSGVATITLDSGNEMFGVICQMDNMSKHKRSEFKIGEKVKLKGICTGILMDVVLVRCIEI